MRDAITVPADACDSIPVVDLEPSFSTDLARRRAVAREIRAAGCATGFFYVRNHGVPAEIMIEHLAFARAFFALPDAEKREIDIRFSNCTRGYEPMAAQVLDAGSPADAKEGFLIGNDLDADHPYVRAGVPNTGANVWPRNPPRLREHFTRYVAHMLGLGRHLMSCLALSLELPEDYFDDGLADPTYVSRLLHYPPATASLPANTLGAGAHVDWGLLTILLQDDVGGLEVQTAAREWIAAPYIPQTFIVNLGEMFAVLTNGLYRASMHRVLSNTSGRSRYSAPTFIDPEYFYRVACVPTCLPDHGKPHFPPVTVGEHLAERYRQTYVAAQ
jgi:isopenicillin N synthase-like dioxygenase